MRFRLYHLSSEDHGHESQQSQQWILLDFFEQRSHEALFPHASVERADMADLLALKFISDEKHDDEQNESNDYSTHALVI